MSSFNLSVKISTCTCILAIFCNFIFCNNLNSNRYKILLFHCSVSLFFDLFKIISFVCDIFCLFVSAKTQSQKICLEMLVSHVLNKFIYEKRDTYYQKTIYWVSMNNPVIFRSISQTIHMPGRSKMIRTFSCFNLVDTKHFC